MTDIVARERTSLSDAALRDTIADAYQESTGDVITMHRTRVLWSMLAMEHGAGADRSAPVDARAGWNCFCFNFGNRRGVDGDLGRYMMDAAEIIDGHEKVIGGGWPAYSTALLGMTSWMHLLQMHYASAWACSFTGDIVRFAEALKAGGYFTAGLDRYTAGMSTWSRFYQRTWA